jgi:uncharacterized surface protein with fasciclin (FAS1) repeats
MRFHLSSLRRLTRLAGAALALSLGATAGMAQATAPSALSTFLQCRHATLTNFNGTIVDAAVATPELSTLVSLVQAADLAGALSGKGPLTVYAPTNDAFAKVPGALVDLLAANPPLLTSVLTYHVSAGALDPRRVTSPVAVKTLQGQTVFYSIGKNGPTINQSTASCKGVKTTNGVVWIIDSVLLPQFK